MKRINHLCIVVIGAMMFWQTSEAASNQPVDSGQSSVGVTLIAPEGSEKFPPLEEEQLGGGFSERPAIQPPGLSDEEQVRLPQTNEKLTHYSLTKIGWALLAGVFLLKKRRQKKCPQYYTNK